jgi:hypothetical protein
MQGGRSSALNRLQAFPALAWYSVPEVCTMSDPRELRRREHVREALLNATVLFVLSWAKVVLKNPAAREKALRKRMTRWWCS